MLLLYWGKTLLIPFSFAGLVSILLYPGCKWLEQKGWKRGAAIGVSLLMLLLLSSVLLLVIGWQLVALGKELPQLATKAAQLLDELQQWASQQLHISLDQQIAWFENTLINISSNLGSMLIGTVDVTVSVLFFLVMVPLFAGLIVYYRSRLVNFLYALLPAASHPSIGPALGRVCRYTMTM